jgi:hypothetical protein
MQVRAGLLDIPAGRAASRQLGFEAAEVSAACVAHFKAADGAGCNAAGCSETRRASACLSPAARRAHAGGAAHAEGGGHQRRRPHQVRAQRRRPLPGQHACQAAASTAPTLPPSLPLWCDQPTSRLTPILLLVLAASPSPHPPTPHSPLRIPPRGLLP